MIRLCAALWMAPLLAAQVRSLELTFDGIGCASCIESLPRRIERMRGVDSATLDPQAKTLTIRLAPHNRIRIEQIRDAIEQDGTKARRAAVRASGAVARDGNRWVFRLPNSSILYPLAGASPRAEGPHEVAAEIPDLHPSEGALVWSVQQAKAVP